MSALGPFFWGWAACAVVGMVDSAPWWVRLPATVVVYVIAAFWVDRHFVVVPI